MINFLIENGDKYRSATVLPFKKKSVLEEIEKLQARYCFITRGEPQERGFGR